MRDALLTLNSSAIVRSSPTIASVEDSPAEPPMLLGLVLVLVLVLVLPVQTRALLCAENPNSNSNTCPCRLALLCAESYC